MCYCFFKYDGDAGFFLIWKARGHALTDFIYRHRLKTLFPLSPNPSGCETTACQLLHSRRAPSGGGHMQQRVSYVGQATHRGSSFGLCCMMCCFFVAWVKGWEADTTKCQCWRRAAFWESRSQDAWIGRKGALWPWCIQECHLHFGLIDTTKAPCLHLYIYNVFQLIFFIFICQKLA